MDLIEFSILHNHRPPDLIAMNICIYLFLSENNEPVHNLLDNYNNAIKGCVHLSSSRGRNKPLLGWGTLPSMGFILMRSGRGQDDRGKMNTDQSFC